MTASFSSGPSILRTALLSYTLRTNVLLSYVICVGWANPWLRMSCLGQQSQYHANNSLALVCAMSKYGDFLLLLDQSHQPNLV